MGLWQKDTWSWSVDVQESEVKGFWLLETHKIEVKRDIVVFGIKILISYDTIHMFCNKNPDVAKFIFILLYVLQ
jgi:hypothetical protein